MEQELLNLSEALNEKQREILLQGISESGMMIDADDAILVLLSYLLQAGFKVTLHSPESLVAI